MTHDPRTGRPRRPAKVLFALCLGVLLLIVALSVYLYMGRAPVPERGSGSLPQDVPTTQPKP
jgi:hypothetical protein